MSESCKNILEMVEYLEDQGWKLGKSKAYADGKARLIRVQEDGSVLKADADVYAARNLKRREGKAPTKKLEGLQDRKLEEELRRLVLDNADRQMKLDQKAGLLVPRAEVDKLLAGAVVMLRTNMDHFILARIREIIFHAGGTPDHETGLIEYLREVQREWFNQFAREATYRVRFGGQAEEDLAAVEEEGDDDLDS